MARSSHQTTAVVWVLTIFFHFIPGLVLFLASPVGSLERKQGAIMLTGAGVFALLALAGAILTIIGVGVLIGIAAGIWGLFVCIKGAMDCSAGKDYEPAIIAGLAKGIFRV